MGLGSFLVGTALAAPAACTAVSPPHTVAVVELYTSQGCSSCPPADRWLAQLRPGERVVPLSLHVGYWDYIGWKDPFARREFNDRQRTLALANGSRSVYTPGVFVQGRETPRWSDARGFEAALNAVNAEPARARIALEVRRADGGIEVQLRTEAPGAPQARAQLALLQGGHRTAVTAGENRGETLRNEHVVRDWSPPLPLGTARHRFAVPAGGGPLNLVALVLDGARPLQALPLPLAACPP